jgi:hypothetical protein
MIQRSVELSIVYTNRITKKKKRFAIPIVAKTFHKDSHPRKSITHSVLGKLLKVIRMYVATTLTIDVFDMLIHTVIQL